VKAQIALEIGQNGVHGRAPQQIVKNDARRTMSAFFVFADQPSSTSTNPVDRIIRFIEPN